MSSPSENKETIRRLIQAFNAQDRESFDAAYADQITVHGHDAQRTMDHEAHWEEVQATFAVFPDLKADLLGMIAEGDRVFLYWTYSGTHLGKGKTVGEPTGIEARWPAFADYRLEDGKVVEAWQLHDRMTMFVQLGVVRMPGPEASS